MRGLRGVMAGLSIALLAACTLPTGAVAAGEPTITAVAIDATDHFVASWRLAPNTRFDTIEFSSTPIPSPLLPGAFAGRNVIASECAPPPKTCAAPPTLAAYRSNDRVARDRRYFVKVSALNSRGRTRTSAVWVIDERKPLLPGGGRPSPTASNASAVGLPYIAPARSTIARPTLALVSRPKLIAGVVRFGVRARVGCPGTVCYALVGLELGSRTLVFSDATIKPDGSETFVLRPVPKRRAVLRRRTRARLQVRAVITQPGGKRTTLVRADRPPLRRSACVADPAAARGERPAARWRERPSACCRRSRRRPLGDAAGRAWRRRSSRSRARTAVARSRARGVYSDPSTPGRPPSEADRPAGWRRGAPAARSARRATAASFPITAGGTAAPISSRR